MMTQNEFKAKCETVAKSLNATFKPQDCMASWIYIGYFTMVDGGEEFVVRQENREGHPVKMEVAAVWPKNKKNEVFYPYASQKTQYTAINVSGTRPADAIAKDIARRFLPGLKAEYAIQKERAINSDNYLNATASNAANLAKLAGEKQHQHSPNKFSLRSDRSDLWGHAEVSGDNVSIELRSLSPAQAEAIIKLIKTL